MDKLARAAMTDGTSVMSWARFISTVGVTSIITLGGGYWVANYVVANQLRIIEKLDIVTAQNIAIAQMIEARSAETQRADDEFKFYARTICVLLTDMNESKANICIPSPNVQPVRSSTP